MARSSVMGASQGGWSFRAVMSRFESSIGRSPRAHLASASARIASAIPWRTRSCTAATAASSAVPPKVDPRAIPSSWPPTCVALHRFLAHEVHSEFPLPASSVLLTTCVSILRRSLHTSLAPASISSKRPMAASVHVALYLTLSASASRSASPSISRSIEWNSWNARECRYAMAAARQLRLTLAAAATKEIAVVGVRRASAESRSTSVSSHPWRAGKVAFGRRSSQPPSGRMRSDASSMRVLPQVWRAPRLPWPHAVKS
mmetsp:Transcript_52400/g.135784  ORF Transcript_52400/g.135784 Transcript_52400/m.135784 type:complete len:259 (-) Transcript_52400:1116-1892(-)